MTNYRSKAGKLLGFVVLVGILIMTFAPPVVSGQQPIPTKRPKWPPGQPTLTPTATATLVPIPTATSTPVCEFTVPKDISTNTIWQAGCTYIAPNGILVKAGVLLTIPEGVTVLIGSWKTFLVQGTLHVRGTAAEPVVMRRQLEDLSWTGLSFQSASQPTSDLTYLTLEGGYAGLVVYSGSVWSTNCIFEGWRPFGER